MIAVHAASGSTVGRAGRRVIARRRRTVSNGGRLPAGSVTLADGAPAGAAHAASSRRAASGAARRGGCHHRHPDDIMPPTVPSGRDRSSPGPAGPDSAGSAHRSLTGGNARRCCRERSRCDGHDGRCRTGRASSPTWMRAGGLHVHRSGCHVACDLTLQDPQQSFAVAVPGARTPWRQAIEGSGSSRGAPTGGWSAPGARCSGSSGVSIGRGSSSSDGGGGISSLGGC